MGVNRFGHGLTPELKSGVGLNELLDGSDCGSLRSHNLTLFVALAPKKRLNHRKQYDTAPNSHSKNSAGASSAFLPPRRLIQPPQRQKGLFYR